MEPRPETCALCEGRCPDCGGDVGEAAGSLHWVLCSLCHATFRHEHVRDEHVRHAQVAEPKDEEADEGD